MCDVEDGKDLGGPFDGYLGGRQAVRLALPDLPHHRVHIGEVPDLGELAVFEAIKSELRNSHPTTGRLNSLEGPRWVPVTVKCTAI